MNKDNIDSRVELRSKKIQNLMNDIPHSIFYSSIVVIIVLIILNILLSLFLYMNRDFFFNVCAAIMTPKLLGFNKKKCRKKL